MSRIIYCSDLVLRIENPDEDITNITEWIHDSTEFRPQYPDECVVRQEVGSLGKLSVIFMVWTSLVVLTVFYCYFCEQRLFPRQRFLDWTSFGPSCRRPFRSVSRTSSFLSNYSQGSIRTRRETLRSMSFSSQDSLDHQPYYLSSSPRFGGHEPSKGLNFGEFRLLNDSPHEPIRRFRGPTQAYFGRSDSQERLTEVIS